jgi:hypothetical protein
MLAAYLDEFGHIGPYISAEHPKFSQHPIFGYAGFVIQADRARAFEESFEHAKERKFRSDIVAAGVHHQHWERKGSEMFTTGSFERYPDNMVMMGHLVQRLRQLGGRTFFYGQVKPLGTARQTHDEAPARNGHVLQQSVKMLAQYAAATSEQLMVFLDRTDRSVREAAVTAMAKAIFSWDSPGMRQIVQIPSELESHRYGSIQFADWIAAATTRASHFHLVEGSGFSWAPEQFRKVLSGSWLSESHIRHRDMQVSVSPKKLEHDRPWLDRQGDRQRSADRSSSSLSHQIGAEHPALQRMRHDLEAGHYDS